MLTLKRFKLNLRLNTIKWTPKLFGLNTSKSLKLMTIHSAIDEYPLGSPESSKLGFVRTSTFSRVGQQQQFDRCVDRLGRPKSFINRSLQFNGSRKASSREVVKHFISLDYHAESGANFTWITWIVLLSASRRVHRYTSSLARFTEKSDEKSNKESTVKDSHEKPKISKATS